MMKMSKRNKMKYAKNFYIEKTEGSNPKHLNT